MKNWPEDYIIVLETNNLFSSLVLMREFTKPRLMLIVNHKSIVSDVNIG